MKKTLILKSPRHPGKELRLTQKPEKKPFKRKKKHFVERSATSYFS